MVYENRSAKGKDRRKQWGAASLKGHKSRGYDIYISTKQLFQKTKVAIYCPLCGCKLKWIKGRYSANSPTLDRIDNETYLSVKNTWIICRQCNSTKGARTIEQFFKYCEETIKMKEYIFRLIGRNDKCDS